MHTKCAHEYEASSFQYLQICKRKNAGREGRRERMHVYKCLMPFLNFIGGGGGGVFETGFFCVALGVLEIKF